MPDMGRHLPSPRTALGPADRPQRAQLPGPLHPAAVLPSIIRDLHLSDTQAGSLQIAVHLDLRARLAAVRLARGSPPALALAAIGVFVWSGATVGSGLAASLRDAGAGARADRRRRGQLRRRHPLADLRLLPGRAAAARWPSSMPPSRPGSALGYMLGGTGRRAHFGWRGAFFVAGGPGPVLALALLLLREPPRGRVDRARARPPSSLAARVAARLARRARATWSTRRRRPSTPSPSAAWRSGCRPTSCASAASRCDASPPVRPLPGPGRLRWARSSAATSATASARFRPAPTSCFSGIGLVASLPFTLLAVLAPSPAIFWPSMFVTLLLLFLNTGPLNAAMANVLPAELRGRGFARQHLRHPPARRRALAARSSAWPLTASACRCRCWSPASCWSWPGWCCSRAAPPCAATWRRAAVTHDATFDRELEAAAAHRRARPRALVRGFHGTRADRRAQGGRRAGHRRRPRGQRAHRRAACARPSPRTSLLSEELPDDGARLGQSRVWMVDPIDGTRDFIAGDDGFAVMIGLCVDGRPRVGARRPARSPARSTRGVAGGGAWSSDADGAARPCSTSTQSAAPRHPAGRLEIAPHARHRRLQQALGIEDEINVGSVGVKVGLVADGTATSTSTRAAAPRSGTPAAPRPSCSPPGGRVTDVDGAPLSTPPRALQPARHRGLQRPAARLSCITTLVAPPVPRTRLSLA